MNLNHLKTFITIARQGSLLAASRRLGIPNSTIGRHLSQFEQQMGMQLVLRNTRHLRLTEEGKDLYKRTEHLLSELDEVENELRSDEGDISGKITVAIPSEFGVKWLNACIAEFAAEHPRVSIECITSMAPLDPVRRDVDVSISYHRGKFDDSGMVSRPLIKLPSVVVASPGLAAKYGASHTVEKLPTLPCISTLIALKANPWHFINQGKELFSLNIDSRYKVDSSQMLISGAIAGIGYAIIPYAFCKEHIASGELVSIEMDYEPAPLEIVAIYPNRSIPYRSKLLIERISKSLSRQMH